MSRHPEVKWAQRVDKIFVTVQLPDAKDVNINLEPAGVLTFSGTAGAENHLYELNLELYDKVNVEESKINKGVRSIFCILEKAEKGWWKKLLRGDGKTPHYVKVDWDKWVDEDDDGTGDVNLEGMDFSKFGGMEGMGGMGMEGMGGMGMGGMEGMGMGGMGMGGMGMGGMGMGGMEGMGMGDGDFDDSDDEGEEVEKPTETEEMKTSDAPVEEKVEAAPTSSA